MNGRQPFAAMDVAAGQARTIPLVGPEHWMDIDPFNSVLCASLARKGGKSPDSHHPGGSWVTVHKRVLWGPILKTKHNSKVNECIGLWVLKKSRRLAG
jgi:hypothetical protein